MKEKEPSSESAAESANTAKHYKPGRITRREALKRFGVIAGGVSLTNFGLFEGRASGTPLEAMGDPSPSSEESSSEESSVMWKPTSSDALCSSCDRQADGSYASSWWTSSSSSSWSVWWVIINQ